MSISSIKFNISSKFSLLDVSRWSTVVLNVKIIIFNYEFLRNVKFSIFFNRFLIIDESILFSELSETELDLNELEEININNPLMNYHVIKGDKTLIMFEVLPVNYP